MKTTITLFFCFISISNMFGQQIVCLENNKKNMIDTTGTAVFENQKGKLLLPAESHLKIDTIIQQNFSCGLGADKKFIVICNPKTNVVCVAKGTVSKIARLENSWLVIVRHGKYLSVYKNLDTVFVTELQNIERGVTIGKVASFENETYLEFQLWKNKSQISAKEWFYYQ